jgi:hypothetical protein
VASWRVRAGAALILTAGVAIAIGGYLLLGGFADHDWSWMAIGPVVMAAGVGVGFWGDRVGQAVVAELGGDVDE